MKRKMNYQRTSHQTDIAGMRWSCIG